ncbi:MAG: glycoside hydrolase family 127 protein [Dysgonomonas sp.]|nr:glycoside hydrolase family 127 protein [Dysgonomonas sp.]
MKKNIALLCSIFVLGLASLHSYSQGLTPVTFDKVTLNDTFWSNRMKIQKEVLVPVAFERTHGAVEDLRLTGNYLKGIEGTLPAPHRFNISDLFKVIEGAAYLLKMERDPELEKEIDNIAETLALAQEKDGYIYPAHTTGTSKDHEHWGGSGMGDKPYSWVVHSHELYNVGHLYEAAVAYYQATGKKNLLDIAEKNAQHVNKAFFEGDAKYNNGKPVNQAPGHQEIELALVKLYRVTENPLYLDMAKKFIDVRGVTYIPDGKGTMSPEYAQQQAPVRDQDEAVGHAVRAVYLYSGMSDVGALTNDPTLNPALDKIWHNIVDTRMHITGGLGAVHGIEGFGPEYELPNKEAYNETCAAVGNVFFNHRMFLLEKDGKYMDVAEVALLNNVLAGVNLEGNKFFYVNPLESSGMVDRSHWFGTACCPTNMARLVPQVSGLMYAYEDNDIYCSFYTSNTVDIPLKSGKVNLVQNTSYPFDENIQLTVNPEKNNQQFAVKMRIPTWAGSQFIPGKLYNYIDNNSQLWEVHINGKKASNKEFKKGDVLLDKGFVSINRKWKKGDKIELRLPMPVHYSHAIDEVKADNGRVAITRGPLVYCAEGIDNKGSADRYFIETRTGNATVTKEANGALKDIDFVKNIPAKYIDGKGNAVSSDLTLVPYYAWNNRGVSSMNIWFAETEEKAKEGLSFMPLLLKDVKATQTNGGEDVLSIVNGKYPKNSFDNSIERWTAWPQTGKEQSIEFTFETPTNLKSFSVYWYDDKGGVQAPKRWNLEYKENGNGEWKPFPLYSTDSYSVLKDQFNLVHSDGDSFIITNLRMNMKPLDDSAVGILQVKFDTK